jgi:hypothetical protein
MVCNLWILVPEAVALNIERITPCLRPSIEQCALPLDAAESVEMAMWAADKIASVDRIQLGSGPQVALILSSSQSMPKDPIHFASLVGSHHKTGCAVLGVLCG